MLTNIFLVGLTATFASAYDDSKIVGGSEAGEGEYPHHVAIKGDKGYICEGSILDEITILTAAHCLDGQNTSRLTVTVGTNNLNQGGDVYNVKSFTLHERYCNSTIRNDIGIIKLEKRIVFSKKVQPVLLETKNVEAGREAVVSGWGKLGNGDTEVSNNLQHIKLKILSYEECKQYHFCPNVNQNQICAFNKGTKGICGEDSGGALLLDGRQIGVASWGNSCARKRPNVYVKVSSYISWIYRNK